MSQATLPFAGESTIKFFGQRCVSHAFTVKHVSEVRNLLRRRDVAHFFFFRESRAASRTFGKGAIRGIETSDGGSTDCAQRIANGPANRSCGARCGGGKIDPVGPLSPFE